MTHKYELFLVTQKKKKAHKSKIIQTFSSSNFIYKVRYTTRFFYLFLFYFYWNSRFLI